MIINFRMLEEKSKSLNDIGIFLILCSNTIVLFLYMHVNEIENIIVIITKRNTVTVNIVEKLIHRVAIDFNVLIIPSVPLLNLEYE